MPGVAIQQMLDPTAPHGMRNYNKAHWLRELPDEAIDEQVEHHAEVPSPMSLIINGRMGGAIERVPREATAFGHRDANRQVWVISAHWEGDDAEHIEWCRGVFDAMTPYSTAASTSTRSATRVRTASAPATPTTSGGGWWRRSGAGTPTTSST